jgi:hypothetical protein
MYYLFVCAEIFFQSYSFIIQIRNIIYTFYDMKLDETEVKFISELANIVTDSELAAELSRIRYERGINKRVTIDQVRKARYKLGISKRQGRGKCQINERRRENE